MAKIDIDVSILYIKDNKVNLCDSCVHNYPQCSGNKIIFGDGLGKDNICCCNKYEVKNDTEDEVWNFVRAYANMNCSQHEKAYGDYDWWDVFSCLSYQEAKARYDALKNPKEEIYVGDEVIYCGDKYIVVYVGPDEVYHIIDKSWIRCVVQGKPQLQKTGRHYPEVLELLKGLKGNE